MPKISSIHDSFDNRDLSINKQDKLFYNGAEILFDKESRAIGFKYEDETVNLVKYDTNDSKKTEPLSPELLKTSIDEYVKARQTTLSRDLVEQQTPASNKHKLSEHKLQKQDKTYVTDLLNEKNKLKALEKNTE